MSSSPKASVFPHSGSTSEEAAISAFDITFRYPVGDRDALSAVSLNQGVGQLLGVMGASGAGKSTLAKCLNRIVPAFEGGRFEGAVTIGGIRLDGLRVCDVAPMVGMVFQDFESQLFSTSVIDEVAFALQQLGFERAEIGQRVDEALGAVGLSGFERRDPTTLSGGEKQRLAIAAVMALRPAVIVLDEPTTDLDPEGRAEVYRLIGRMRGLGVTMVLVDHESEELRACDRILVLQGGQLLAEGTPAEILGRSEWLEQCGIRPPEINHLLARLGLGNYAASLDMAEQLVRRALKPRSDPGSAGPAAPQVAAGLSLSEGPKASLNEALDEVPIVELRGLSHSYNAEQKALDNIDLTIRAGEFVALVGRNGSGKSTLAKQIVGLLKPTAGRVLIDGRDRSELRGAEIARQVGYVFQNPDHQIFAGTVEEEVAFGPRNFGLEADEVARRCERVLREVGLDHALSSDPFMLGRGERQRLAVAGVLVLQPRLLILDEPTTGLDYRETRHMMGLVSELNRAGTAVMIITHTPWLVAHYARRVVLMRTGRKQFDGPVREFFAEHELLAQSSFRPPEAAALAQRLGFDALSVEELVAALKPRIEPRGRV